jgi:hypothetical protein
VSRNLSRHLSGATRLAVAVLTACELVAAFVAAPAGAASVAPLTLHLKQVTRTVTGSGAQFQAPKVTVTGGRSEVARAITAAVSKHENALATRFAADAADAIGNGARVSMVFDAVYGSVDRSVHYLTVVLSESVMLGGAHPANSEHAYTFDVTTGRELAVHRLFTTPRHADHLIRAAIIAQNRQAQLNAQDVATLTIVPDRTGSTAPLSCWPAPAGLRCTVDQGSVLDYASGEFEATVSWRALATRQ